MKSVAIAVACALLACGDTPRPVSHPKYGYFSGPTITGTVTSVTAGTGLTGGTITRSGTIAADTSVVQSRVSGTCTGSNAIQTVNADGTVTCVAAGGGGGSVTSVGTGTGLTGGPITTTGTIALANTAVTAGSYTLPVITVNAQGQLTAASNYVGTSCGAGTAIQLLSAAGAASCVTVGSGTVTSVATTAPITGGTITTGGTIGLNESSNLRTSGGALDLSTAVTMPGSLAVKSLAGTAQSVTTSADDVALAATTTVVNYTGTLDTTWGGFVSTGERWIYVANTTTHALALIGEDASTTAADRITTNMGSDGFSIPPHSGTWLKYDTVTSRWIVTGIFGNACPAGEFANGINPDGSLACGTPAGGGGTIASTTDLLKGDGAGNAVAFAGSTCAAGTAATGIGATGALACGITPITNSSGTNVIPKSNASGNLVASSLSDNGSTITTSEYMTIGGWFQSAAVIDSDGNAGPYMFTGFSCNEATNAAATCYFNRTGYAVGVTQFRSLEIDDGEGTGAGHEALTVDGSTRNVATYADTTLGSLWSNTTTNKGQPVCSGTTPTVTGTGTTIVGTNCSGTVTIGSPGLSTFTINFDASHPWSNTPPCTFTWIASSNVALWISSQSTSAVAVKLASTAQGAVNYQCGWGY